MDFTLSKIEETAWLARLRDPECHFLVDMFGHPFRFRAGSDWDTTQKKLDQHLLYLILSGSCYAVLEKQRFTLAAGQFCWITPGCEFRLHARAPKEHPVLCRFRFELTAGSISYTLPWNFRIGSDAHSMLEWSRALVTEAEHPGRFAAEIVASYALLISTRIFEQTSSRPAEELPRLPRDLCEKVTQLVLEHPEKRYRPADLAKLCGLSSDYFSRLFRSAFGVSPKQWLLKQRLRSAASLLRETDQRISEIAEHLGYDDFYLFSRQFKQEYGNSPRQWRERLG